LHTLLTGISNHATAGEAHSPTARQAGNAVQFLRVLQSSTSPATTATPSTTASTTPVITTNTTTTTTKTTSSVPHLGPFTGDPNTKPAQAIPDPVPTPAATYTPLPASQQALLNQPWDPFNQAQHEATMNNWYMNQVQHSNQQKLQTYERGLADWKVNVERCRDLGLQTPPPPAPPVLEAVGPMPDGYWFGKA